MPINGSDFFQRAAEEANGLLGAAAGLAADAAGAAIAAPDLTGPIPDLGKEAARGVCRRYGADPSGVSGRLAAGLERVCRPYLDTLSPGGAAGVKLPFRGGQCAADYQVQGFWRTESFIVCSNGVTGGQQAEQFFSTEFRVPGPISGFSLRRITPAACGGFDGFVIEAQTPLGPDIVFQFAGTGGVRREVSFRISALNIGTGTDSCGNPDPVIVPPDPTPDPGPFPFPYNPSPDIDIDIDIDFGPDGDINIDFGVGPISIDPFGGGGGGGGDGGGSPVSGLPPGDIGEPGTPVLAGAGEAAEGEAPPNSVLVGLKINILPPLPNTSEYDPDVRRGAAYVYMGTPGNLALDPAGVALRSGQFFFAPIDNLTAWRVSANVGYVLQVIPYYRELEATEV